MAKSLIFGLIYASWDQIRAEEIFLTNLALLVIRYHGQLSSCTILEKTNDPILRKLGDGPADGRTDRWTRVIS